MSELRQIIREAITELLDESRCIYCGDITNEDLRKWFGKGGAGGTTKGGWDRYGSDGQKLGKCGGGKEGGAYAACLSAEKARKLGPKGRAAFVRRKRAAQKKAGDFGRKVNKEVKVRNQPIQKNRCIMAKKWSQKYKRSIDCNNPKGFSQKAHCAGRKKRESIMNIKSLVKETIKQVVAERQINLFVEKNTPTKPSKWSYYKSQAKKKFDVYPSAYANAWAAKKYKAAGGGWKKG